MSTVLRMHEILRRPLITERTTALHDKQNVFAFEVLPDASKDEIKDAVETLFSVSVNGVRTVNVRGKRRVFARRAGKRKNWKKAYVSLAEGHTIEMDGGA